jgi:hypothetical protein
MAANETQMFFRLSSELRAAERSEDSEAVRWALVEVIGLWLHAETAAVRARCEHILEAHGLAGEMAALNEQWAS